MLKSILQPILSPILIGVFGDSGSTPPPSVTPVLGTPTVTDTTMTLIWTMSDDTGVTDYVVEYKASSSATWLVFSDGTSTSKTATITGLSATTSYDARVKAVNGAGSGDYSNVQTAFTTLNPELFSQTFATYHADNVDNTVSTYTSTFTVHNGSGYEITPVVDPLFEASSYPNALVNGVVPVRFTTTGTLPSPLLANTDYHLSPTTGGKYEIYPVATETDIAVLETAITGENVLPAQNYFQKLNKINITNSGTGTHTVTRDNLLSILVDSVSNYDMTTPVPTNYHSHQQLKIDNDGDKYLYTGGALVKNDTSGYYSVYGKAMLMTSDRINGRLETTQKRFVWQMFVYKTRKHKTRNLRKNLMQASGFDVATNVLTTDYIDTEDKDNNRFATGDECYIKPVFGGTLPGGLVINTPYYVSKITNKTFTLHATLSDAQAAINPINITSQGSGFSMIYMPKVIGQTQVFNFPIEVLNGGASGANVLSPRQLEITPNAQGIMEADSFRFSGAEQGDVYFLYLNDLDTVRIWAPPGVTLPPELTNEGTYYITKKTGSANGLCRMHLTMQDAIDSVGLATNDPNCKLIKFTAAATGKVLFEYNDGNARLVYGNEKSTTAVRMNPVPFNAKNILFLAIDYNPPTGTEPVAYLKYNHYSIQTINLGGAKGLTDALVYNGNNETANPWTLFNSAQGHVPIDMDFYSLAMGASATDTIEEGDIISMMNWFSDKYTISTYTPPFVGKPDAIDDLIAYAGNASLACYWTAPNNNYYTLLEYRVYYRVVGSGNYTLWETVSPNTLSSALTGLTNNTSYEIDVRAVNTKGEAISASPTVQRTPSLTAGLPDAITTLNLFVGISEIFVQWTRPNDNGFVITGHKIYYRIAGSGSAFTLFSSPATGSGLLSETITGLTNGVTYEVDVRSVNLQGESAAANTTKTSTPSSTPNMKYRNTSCVMDIDVTISGCYSGSGTVLNNLVTIPADGSLQAAYNIQRGDGSTTTTYPSFVGTAGSPAALLNFDGGDYLTLIGNNTEFLNNLGRTDLAQAFTLIMVFDTIINHTNTQVLMTTRNGSTEFGVQASISATEILTFNQRGNTGSSASVLSSSAVPTGTAPTYLAIGYDPTQVSASRGLFWIDSTTSEVKTASYNTCTTNPTRKLILMSQGTGTGSASSAVANGTRLKSVSLFNTRLTDAEIATVMGEYTTRHGVTY